MALIKGEGGARFKEKNKSKWKGIVLAGGSGTRLYPTTQVISKHLLPVYDKPMIYYPLSVLMLAGIQDILIISTPNYLPMYQSLLGDGTRFGLCIEYAIQPSPDGIAQAFIIGEKFIGEDSVCLILGDNIFFGQGLRGSLQKTLQREVGATIFAYQVRDPKRFGVVEFDDKYKVISIEEKPSFPRSNFAVTGLYFYDNNVIKFAKNIKPSNRGELEITNINKKYLKQGNLCIEELGRGFAWLDTGTNDSLMEAGHFIQTIENRQGFKVACLEEIACRNGWITAEKMIKYGFEIEKTDYGRYLIDLGREIELSE